MDIKKQRARLLSDFFTEKNLSLEQIAQATQYEVRYINNLLTGIDRLNDRARWRLFQAFPDIGPILTLSDAEVLARASDNGSDPASEAQ